MTILVCVVLQSVSDDSFELGSSNKNPSVLDSLGKPPFRPVKKNPVSVPWWQNDDDDDIEEGAGWLSLLSPATILRTIFLV